MRNFYSWAFLFILPCSIFAYTNLQPRSISNLYFIYIYILHLLVIYIYMYTCILVIYILRNNFSLRSCQIFEVLRKYEWCLPNHYDWNGLEESIFASFYADVLNLFQKALLMSLYVWPFSTLRKLYFHFLSHWMGYDRGDSFPLEI